MARGRVRLGWTAVLFHLALFAIYAPTWAETRVVGPGDDLAAVLAEAGDGDEVIVRGGRHPGPLVITHSLHLRGEGWPVIDGGGQGTVVAIRAPGVRFEGFEVRGSGRSLDQENSGLAVEAPEALVVGNRFDDVLFGIYLRKARGGRLEGNRIRGKSLDLPRRGDAIRVWYSDGTRIVDNRVEDSRDIVLWYSADLLVRGNTATRGRYGLHFMYCDDARIEANVLADNSVGAFLMYSRRLRMFDNVLAANHGPSGYGIGLKDMDDAVIEGNLFLANRIGIFLDNTPREIESRSRVAGNLFTANAIGISLLPNVRRGVFEDNAFEENGQQVAIAGGGGDPTANRWQGNYWSDYVGYDADGDDRGDLPHRPVRLYEALSDRRPELRLFLGSPATRAMDLAARAFPLVAPHPKLVDDSPRMTPPRPAAALRLAESLPRESGTVGFLGLTGGLLAALALLFFQATRPDRALASPRPAPAPPLDGATAGKGAAPPGSSPDGPPTALVEVRGLGRRFGPRTALEGVSFDIDLGESVAIWGDNGAGKTTVLRALLGVMPYEGSVRLAVDGQWHESWRDGKPARSRIGFVPQEASLQGDLGVLETMIFFARLRRLGGQGIPGLLDRLGLRDEQEKRVRELSGGLRQRLALALALLSDPPILVLDEPTANLDLVARRELLALLARLKGEGKTLLFTTHRVDEVLLLADRVLHLEKGRLVADTSPRQLLAAPDRPVELWLLLAEEDRAEGRRRLEDEGWACQVFDGQLVVLLPARHKVDPLITLLAADLAVIDFELREGAPAVDLPSPSPSPTLQPTAVKDPMARDQETRP